MGVNIDGLDRLSANIQQLARQQVPKAAVKAVNAVAKKAGRAALKSVANDIGVPLKTLKGRLRTTPAKGNVPKAKMRVNRLNMPAIRLLENRSTKIWAGQGGIVVGKYAIERGFKQRLANGRVHILQRKSAARYPIDVVKIPLAAPLTQAFRRELQDYPAQLQT